MSQVNQDDILKAFREWQLLQPTADDRGLCCSDEVRHFWKDANGHLKDKPDHMVCAREQAWRRYIRARDGKTEKTVH